MTSEDKNLIELQRRLNLLRSTSSSNKSIIINTSTLNDEEALESPESSSPPSPILSPEEELALNEEMTSYLNDASLSTSSTDLSPPDVLTEKLEAQLKSFETKLPSLPSIPSTSLPKPSTSSSKPFPSSSISPIEILYLSHPSTSTASSTSDSYSNATRKSHEDDTLITRILDELSLENHGLSQDKIQVDNWEERLSRLGKGIDLSGVRSSTSGADEIGGGGGGIGAGEVPSSVDEFERKRKKIDKRKKKGKKKGSSSESSSSESSESESSNSDSD